MNAPTGSGKTLAYLAPIISDLQAQAPHVSRAEGTYALILVPTRELCLQVSDILTLLVRRYIWLVSSLHPGMACPLSWQACVQGAVFCTVSRGAKSWQEETSLKAFHPVVQHSPCDRAKRCLHVVPYARAGCPSHMRCRCRVTAL